MSQQDFKTNQMENQPYEALVQEIHQSPNPISNHHNEEYFNTSNFYNVYFNDNFHSNIHVSQVSNDVQTRKQEFKGRQVKRNKKNTKSKNYQSNLFVRRASEVQEQIAKFELLMEWYNIVESLIISPDKIPLFQTPFEIQDQQQTIFIKNTNIATKNQNKSNQLEKVIIKYQENKKEVFSRFDTQQLEQNRNDSEIFQESQSIIDQLKQQYNVIQTQQVVKCQEFIYTNSNENNVENKKFMNYYNLKEILKNGLDEKPSEHLKSLLIILRNNLEIVQSSLQIKLKQQKKKKFASHVCRICGENFQNGRQLGGHMSRKHPGSSSLYLLKKQVYKTKKIQRSRRTYFKQKKPKKLNKGQEKSSPSSSIFNIVSQNCLMLYNMCNQN